VHGSVEPHRVVQGGSDQPRWCGDAIELTGDQDVEQGEITEVDDDARVQQRVGGGSTETMITSARPAATPRHQQAIAIRRRSDTASAPLRRALNVKLAIPFAAPYQKVLEGLWVICDQTLYPHGQEVLH
jgi:hypothetical protein